MKHLRFGILGTGNIARQFAEGVSHSARCNITAVASRKRDGAESFAKRFQIPNAIEGYQRLLDRADVDAIYISLPNTLHFEWTIASLRAGKHVLCEKPIALNAREAREMFDEAERQRKILVEAFMYLAHPQTHALIDIVKSNELGNIKLIRSSFCYRVRKFDNNIRFNKQLAGGALMDVGCYCVSLSRLIAASEPTEVFAVARMHESGVDEQTTVVMKFPNSITAEFTCGMILQTDNAAYICGDEGYAIVPIPWKPPPGKGEVIIAHSIPPRQDNPNVPPTIPPRKSIVITDAKPLYAIEADAFAAAVLDGTPPFVASDFSVGNMQTLDRIRACFNTSP
ncbi:MAG TPA: Gfo/Idh/MocA family oxidoreductase [Tepidisphaeraceae bacterium]|nr:Gfo/Idh/MocA family oxidoreductase [Tepidisphaeraceae bacterium]